MSHGSGCTGAKDRARGRGARGRGRGRARGVVATRNDKRCRLPFSRGARAFCQLAVMNIFVLSMACSLSLSLALALALSLSPSFSLCPRATFLLTQDHLPSSSRPSHKKTVTGKPLILARFPRTELFLCCVLEEGSRRYSRRSSRFSL